MGHHCLFFCLFVFYFNISQGNNLATSQIPLNYKHTYTTNINNINSLKKTHTPLDGVRYISKMIVYNYRLLQIGLNARMKLSNTDSRWRCFSLDYCSRVNNIYSALNSNFMIHSQLVSYR